MQGRGWRGCVEAVAGAWNKPLNSITLPSTVTGNRTAEKVLNEHGVACAGVDGQDIVCRPVGLRRVEDSAVRVDFQEEDAAWAGKQSGQSAMCLCVC